MQPHLICLDLDGTLLNDNKEISSYTKQVLNELQQRGHQIMIATGRPYRASQMYYHELNLTTPIVNFNGAYVHHPKDKTSKLAMKFRFRHRTKHYSRITNNIKYRIL